MSPFPMLRSSGWADSAGSWPGLLVAKLGEMECGQFVGKAACLVIVRIDSLVRDLVRYGPVLNRMFFEEPCMSC